MVVSKLDDSINYIETRLLDKEDSDLNAALFLIEVLDIPIVIAVGNQKYSFIEKGIIYLPLYLIANNEVEGQIGVYEFMSSQLPDLIGDGEEEIDIGELHDPLIYSFITKEYLEKYKAESSEDDSDSDSEDSVSVIEEEEEDEEDEEEEEEDKKEKKKDKKEELSSEDKIIILGSKSLEDIQDSTRDDDVLLSEPTIIEELFEEEPKKTELVLETKSDDEAIRLKHRGNSNWVQKFFKNKYYSIEDNEGGGDCLFAVIRDAFASIGKKISVAELRSIVAREVTHEYFERTKKMYDELKDAYTTTKEQITELEKKFKDIKEKVETSLKKKKAVSKLGREEKKNFIEQSKSIRSKWKQLLDENVITKQIMSEYRFMKGVTSLDEFRTVIKTCKFWGETWTISTLERILNIKLIMLSNEHYVSGDIDNVLQCGQSNDSILEDRGIFTPKYYIMTDWLGWHFKSILYKGKKILQFEEIPYAVRKLIVGKCLERMSGPYSLIPKFVEEKKRIDAEEDEHVIGTVAELEEDIVSESTKTDTEALYDDDIVFQFYHKSANNKPGKGTGEQIPDDKRIEYAKLLGIKDWRRLLSNYADTPFELDGHKWMSVEHFFQASKFKTSHPEFYLDFSLDSKSDLGKVLSLNPVMAKALGSVSGVYKGKLVRPKSITIDATFTTPVAESAMERAFHAKFTQNKEAKEALTETKQAKLMVYVPKQPPMVFYNLMKFRQMLRDS